MLTHQNFHVDWLQSKRKRYNGDSVKWVTWCTHRGVCCVRVPGAGGVSVCLSQPPDQLTPSASLRPVSPPSAPTVRLTPRGVLPGGSCLSTSITYYWSWRGWPQLQSADLAAISPRYSRINPRLMTPGHRHDLSCLYSYARMLTSKFVAGGWRGEYRFTQTWPLIRGPGQYWGFWPGKMTSQPCYLYIPWWLIHT